MTAPELRIIALQGIPEVRQGDDIAALIVAAARPAPGIEAGDIVVVTQKIVSKAEGRVIALTDVEPTPEAEALAAETEKDPRLVELILRALGRGTILWGAVELGRHIGTGTGDGDTHLPLKAVVFDLR